MIHISNLSKVYTRKGRSDDVVALDNISLTLPEKGFVAILGASGSGKTTLLNIIGGLDKPTNGEMIVDGLSTSTFKNKDWDSYRNEKIGFVLQNCYLLSHLNVQDNVKIKLQINHKKSDEINTSVDEALKAVGLLDKKYDKPKTLSGGQKQRVAIARAIVNKPTVILADEPTGALDSKTGTQIMDILKELSKDHLIVMVTHNNNYASNYADRVITLEDGHVVNDTNPIEYNESQAKPEPLNKVSIPASTTVKWGFKNLIIKKFSTISIIVAASLGLAGVGLILSISSGVRTAFDKAESDAFGRYPVNIYSYSKQSMQGSAEDYEEYPDEPIVNVDYSDFAMQEHYNFMSDKFLTYMDAMPKSNYYVSYQSSLTNFNIFAEVNETRYIKVASTDSIFYKGVSDTKFLNDQYNCLYGKMPTEPYQLALVIDAYNRVDAVSLYSLGFDVSEEPVKGLTLEFNDIIGKKYHYITNDIYYKYNSGSDKYERDPSKTNSDFYNEETAIELEIVGILRERKTNKNALLSSGVIYSPEFAKKVISDANASQIVLDQKYYGVEKNVTTGQPFEDSHSGALTFSKQYFYEQKLYSLGSYERVTALYYFTKNFSQRNKIHDYFKAYVKDKTVDFSYLTYYDYLEHAVAQFDGALGLMTSVLYVFAIISVIVSAILNAILTYISTHQRTNEIGLLRSMGARKKDIALMVETESLLCGLLGGCLSVLFAVLLVKPLNVIVQLAIYRYNFYLLSQTQFDLGGFRPWVAPILIGLAVVTALISALIPSILASRKDPAKAINE